MANPNAGGAQPIAVVTGRPITADTAYPVYQLDATTIGARSLFGGDAQPVVLLSAADLDFNGGHYHLLAAPSAQPVFVVTDGRGTLAGAALPVYVVSGSTPPPVSNVRITDTGDTRTTSAGDTRIVE